MAGQLKRVGPVPLTALAALTLLVLVLHLWLLRGAQQLHDALLPELPEPDRLKAAFVRELKPAAPPTRAAPTPKPGTPKPGTLKPGTLKPGTPEAPPRRFNPVLPPAAIGDGAPAPLPRDVAASDPPPVVEALAAPPALAVSDAVGDWVPGLEWPLSTELRYQLTGFYRGAVYGQARVQWLREASHYQVHLDAEIGPSFAPLMSRRMSSDGEVTPIGLVPRRYDEQTGGLAGSKRRSTLVFENSGVRLVDGRREPVADGTQDAASQFVQLTWMFLTGRHAAQPGWQVPMSLALPQHVHLWRYEVVAQEDVQTPMGPIPAWHIDSRMDDTRGDMQAEIWLAPSLQYLPVRIRIWQNREGGDPTHLDLVLKQPPLQAMAPATLPAGAASGVSAPSGGASP
ncbi:DUF3108 domain-containing protein [Roseateles amylovorans]|uniref:DUF3108 domain-containing protein n=1 Tax=Roseateles amylovorans TaxID=2978473 RepID=A0ABY6B2Z8_9BURK|nr:DUF3108 domain-containing protein [Roseateles amylovorans]UXH77660.1 DUF3108 domain-containing protein [Roseateles amylovorans]